MSSLEIEKIAPMIERLEAARELRGERAQSQDLGAKGSGSFAEMLEKSLEEVNLHQVQANEAIRNLTAGRTKNVHETMLAVERADLSLKLMMQVRNKIIDAYREVMKMQV